MLGLQALVRFGVDVLMSARALFFLLEVGESIRLAGGPDLAGV